MARVKKKIEVPGDIPAPNVEPETPKTQEIAPSIEQIAPASPEIRHRYTSKEGNWVLTPIGWQWREE